MTTTTPTRTRIRIAFAALVALAALAAAAPASAASERADSSCWRRVINDWFADGRVDNIYPVGCYTQAIAHVDSYPDLRAYSSASDDIRRALLAAIRQERGGGKSRSDFAGGLPGNSNGDGSGGSGGGGLGGGGGGGNGGGGNGGGGFATRMIDKLSPGSAESVPLPMLVLGGIALLLLATSALTFVARRVQARRMQVAPAPKQP